MRLLHLKFSGAVILLLLFAQRVAAGPIPTITREVSTEFGMYKPISVNVTPSVKPYEVKPDLSNVVNITKFQLKDTVKPLLAANGFAAQSGVYRQVYDIYNETRDRGIPVFVTTDACLHTYHILYDYMLRILEARYFYTDLINLTKSLIQSSQAVVESASNQAVKQAALDNMAFLSVALCLMDSTALIDKRVSDAVKKEVAQIYALSDGYVPSPLLNRSGYPYLEDYSQYKPRGHYTRSVELQRFFRAMMWYGRITFSLNLTGATQEGLRHAARQALLLSRALSTVTVGAESAATVWDRIYQPTVFFVGKMDDITYSAYLNTAKKQYGEDFLSKPPDILADTAALDGFMAKAMSLPDPQIPVMAGKGYRFMGQRYIPDSYILSELVYDRVDGRMMPRGLDVMAVLGSARAYEILDTLYKDTLFPKYKEQMARLRKEFQGYLPAVWAQNLYYNWLYTLLPLLDVKGQGYPHFMQTPAWTDKDLNTSLGSWAELRHDTILYAKQSETKATGIPNEPPYIMGYVEPEPEVYARLAALAGFMRRGMEDRKILDPQIKDRLVKFEDLMTTLMNISVKELQNTQPSAGEFVAICNFGKTIESLTTFPPDSPDLYRNDADDYMAVIADVHTDPNANEALEVAVGHPLELYVIAPVAGLPTLTRGGIFSYHEFRQKLAAGRLSDEEWQAMQSGPNAVKMPEWTASFTRDVIPVKTSHFDANTRLVTRVEEQSPVPFSFLQNRPNPFNPSTVISYTLSNEGMVRLAVYNLSGQQAAVLLNGRQNAGAHTLIWSPKGLASGIYLIRITWLGREETIRAVYVK